MPPAVDRAGPPCVLLVEDDAGVRATLAAILDDEGCEIVLASNGADALAALEEHDPDCVVLDWMMPVLDGEEFLRVMRKDYGRSTPVLVISAARIEEEQARAACADAFLAKPFDIDELVMILQDLVRRRVP
jgi:CheY-like chemotaxis protein